MTKKWLYGRNVVLTGCSTGMGKEVLMILVKKYGCNVMGVARNKAKLDELKEQLGDKFSYRRFNISSLQDWKDFAAELEGMGFMTDILINNAGMIQPFGQYNDLTDDQIKKVVDIDMLADMTAPLSMMVIGASFGQMSVREMATDLRLLVFSGIKLLLIPIGGMWILSKFVDNSMLLGVCMVMLATPVGSMTAMLAQQYNCDSELASKGVALTTLLSVATIPLVSAACRGMGIPV